MDGIYARMIDGKVRYFAQQQVEIINSSSVLSRPSFLIILRQQPCSGNNIFLSP